MTCFGEFKDAHQQIINSALCAMKGGNTPALLEEHLALVRRVRTALHTRWTKAEIVQASDEFIRRSNNKHTTYGN